jgi:Tol biopolymer transport system component
VARANGRVHRITPWTPDGLTVTSWRSDGRSIAFVRYVHHDPNPSRVWTVGADGRHARFVTYGDYPQWSPDRRWLAYRQPRDTSNNLEMVRPNGTGRHQVTHHRGTFFVGHFSWSPDGRSIAYPFRSPDLRAPQVRIVSASGKLRSRIELPAKVGQATDVDWQPQNRR